MQIKEEDESLIELLLKRQSELNSLLEITRAINQNMSTNFLLEMLEVIIKNSLNIGRFRLMVEADKKFMCVNSFGGVLESPEQLERISEELIELKTPTKLSDHPDDILNIYDFFIPIYNNEVPLAYVLIGEINTKEEFLNHTIDYLQTLVNILMVGLENKKLFKERLQKERLQKEMELAAQVQSMLIPQQLPKNKKIEMFSTYIPHENIGGDFFDYIPINQNEFIWCIADVSGKGISAALLMANFQASLRALSSVENDLEKLVKKINTIVFANTQGDNFITLFIAKYNTNNKKLCYINAGHNPPILFNKDEITYLIEGCMLIGAFDDLPFVKETHITLKKNSLLFNYTDGLVEHDGDNYLSHCENSILKCVSLFKDYSLETIHQELLKQLHRYKKGRDNTDDITLLSLRIL